MKPTLTIANHDRNSAGMAYVYPVVSRRAGGVSVGVNLNPNNACNWACIYCQVPNLVRGAAPEINLTLLQDELRSMLDQILHGDLMRTQVPEDMRHLHDIALSGNGEPTSSRQFTAVIELIGRVKHEFGLNGKTKLVLITNGSLMDRPRVQSGLKKMAMLDGEVWFKLDCATPSGLRRINQTRTSPEKHFERLGISVALCPTWIQTCMFALDGEPPSKLEQDAYLNFIKQTQREKLSLEGVLLYGLARPSLQPTAARLSALSEQWLEHFAQQIRKTGLPCKVSV
ncbi:MAG: radical SAM protein [Thiobacillaceae bacterium]